MRQRYGTTRSLLLVFNVFMFVFALWSAARNATGVRYSAQTFDVIKPNPSGGRLASMDRESDG